MVEGRGGGGVVSEGDAAAMDWPGSRYRSGASGRLDIQVIPEQGSL